MRALLLLLILSPVASAQTVEVESLPSGITLTFVLQVAETLPGGPPDSCEVWIGSDGAPEVVVRSGIASWDGGAALLDVSCMSTCADCILGSFAAGPLESGTGWRIQGDISDGAGSATVEWFVGPFGSARSAAAPTAGTVPTRPIRPQLHALAEDIASLTAAGLDAAIVDDLLRSLEGIRRSLPTDAE